LAINSVKTQKLHLQFQEPLLLPNPTHEPHSPPIVMADFVSSHTPLITMEDIGQTAVGVAATAPPSKTIIRYSASYSSRP